MSVESATYISELVSSNPAATDLRGQGDDHLRLIKAAVKATLPNASKPFYFPSGTSAQTSTVTVTNTDDNKLYPVNCESAARTVNLPQGSTVWDGFTVRVVKADHSNNVLTVDGYSSETINGALTITLWQRYQSAVIQWVEALSAWIATVQEIPPIGMVQPYAGTSAPPGWLLMSGRTIGNASSSATSRANADCRGLFYALWSNYPDSVATVSGGRGASAQIDFDGNKVITVPSMQGRTWAGVDGMDGITVSLLGSVMTSPAVMGAAAGSEMVQLTGAQSGQKAISGAPVNIIDPGHEHVNTGASIGGTGALFQFNLGGSSGAVIGGTAITYAAAVTNISANFSLAESGAVASHSNLQPTRLGTWIIKL